MTATSTEPSQRAGSREWIGLAVLAVVTLLGAFDIGVLFLALPHLSADLAATSTEQIWITNIYLFMFAGFVLTMGTLADRIGHRRLLLIGAAGFGAASLLTAYSTSPEMLIVARALLGIAAAAVSPASLGLIGNMFHDEQQRGVAIGVEGGCMFFGTAVGPVIGGLMLDHWWWGSVFLLAVPVMVVVLIAGPLLLPAHSDPEAVGKIDLTSVVLSLLALLPIIYGITTLSASDGNAGLAVVAIVLGVVFGFLFVRRQLGLPNPLMDLGLLGQRQIRVILPAMLVGSGVLAGTSMLTAQYIQSVAGRSPGQAGLWMALTSLGIAIGSMAAPALVRGLKPPIVIALGVAVATLAMLVLTQAETSGWLVKVVLLVTAVSFGIGPLFSLGNGILIGSAPKERAGGAASMSEVSNLFGSSLGLAILGSIAAAIYRGKMSDADLSPYPSELASRARETVGGGTIDSEPGLISLARHAFTSGFNVVAAIAAVVLLVLMVLLLVTLRGEDSAVADPAEAADAVVDSADAGSEPVDEAGSGAQPAPTR
ncbi:MFS transporter [Jatrophihabitans sp.]|uniref:MFS transporter n=1 Tax=Jatrophihabitans sp. TaxID=1932789 RepID=UPI002C33A531|nr:MFS transporter [Jatrophihabitans sp.]